MDKQQIMQEIALIDRQIHELAGKKRVGRLTSESFPIGTWIASVVFLGYYVAGDLVAADIHATAKWIGLGLGLLLGLSAILSTLKWIKARTRKGNAGFQNNATKIAELQERKVELQRLLAKA